MMMAMTTGTKTHPEALLLVTEAASHGHSSVEHAATVDPNTAATTIQRSSPPRSSSRLRFLAKIILMTGSIVTLVAFALFVAICFLQQIHDTYLFPQLQLMAFDDPYYEEMSDPHHRSNADLTYFARPCHNTEPWNVFETSTRQPLDLVIHAPTWLPSPSPTGSNTTTSVSQQQQQQQLQQQLRRRRGSIQRGVDTMLKHGLGMFPNLISPELTAELREVLQGEAQERLRTGRADPEQWNLIENDYRDTFPVDLSTRPELWQRLFEELAAPKSGSPFFPILQNLMGTPDPAVVELSVILSRKGARDQYTHSDVDDAPYHTSFLPTHALNIPLQDTTGGMGPTHVCPGTHLCGGSADEYCDDKRFDAFIRLSDICLLEEAGDGDMTNATTTSTPPPPAMAATTTTTTTPVMAATCRWNEEGRTMHPNGVWKAGWGVLYNQATVHKGSAHMGRFATTTNRVVDDDDDDDDDRIALFVVFAPTPRFAAVNSNDKNNRVETRQLRTGGTDTLHWTQFGHTFNDYLHSTSLWMRQPLRTLRSLGVLKSKGWNLALTVSMRVASSGFLDDDELPKILDLLRERGWPSRWLPTEEELSPKRIQKQSSEDDDEDPEYLEKFGVWLPLFVQTLSRTRQGLLQIYILALGCHILVLVFVAAWRRWRRQPSTEASTTPTSMASPRQPPSQLSLSKNLLIVLLGHCLILFAAMALRVHVAGTPWARYIRSGKAYRPPPATGGLHQSDGKDGERLDSPPSTLPLSTDILRVPHYASERLFGGYARVVEVAHPGNVYWNNEVIKYAHGYTSLSPSLRRVFCHELVDWTRSDRRFMQLGKDPFWVEIDDLGDLELSFCHQQLILQVNPLLKSLAGAVEALKTEVRYGPWRDMAIHQSTMPAYLDVWWNRLVPSPTPQLQQDNVMVVTAVGTFAAHHLSPFSMWQSTFALPAVTKINEVSPHCRRVTSREPSQRSLLPRRPRQEPFVGAWLKEGDRVEMLEEDEWFTGTIRTAIASQYTYELTMDEAVVVVGEDEDEGDDVGFIITDIQRQFVRRLLAQHST